MGQATATPAQATAPRLQNVRENARLVDIAGLIRS